jgi:hypothetical protein
MLFLRIFLLTFYAAAGWSQTNSSSLPKFENFLASSEYSGTLAELRYPASMEKRYKREIRDNYVVETKPNFAGHFVLLHWSCGTACKEMAIVDARNGNIYFPPITDEGIGVPSYFLPFLTYPNGGTTGPVLQFRTDSRLLIIKCNQGKGWRSYIFYFLWQHDKWRLLRKEPLKKDA